VKGKERNDLLISWVTLSLAFSFVLGPGIFDLMGAAIAIPISFLGVGTAFIFHELAHRQIARKFGCHAEFRAWKFGLILAIILGLLAFFGLGGFIFAAPGAVYIFGPHLTRKQNGIISLAGPATNIVICIAFLAAAYFLMFSGISSWFLVGVFSIVSIINFFIALFNLLPIPPLDGSKIISWDVKIWLLFVIPMAYIFLFGSWIWPVSLI